MRQTCLRHEKQSQSLISSTRVDEVTASHEWEEVTAGHHPLVVDLHREVPADVPAQEPLGDAGPDRQSLLVSGQIGSRHDAGPVCRQDDGDVGPDFPGTGDEGPATHRTVAPRSRDPGRRTGRPVHEGEDSPEDLLVNSAGI